MTFSVHGAGLPDLVEDIRAVVVVVSNGRVERKANVKGNIDSRWRAGLLNGHV